MIDLLTASEHPQPSQLKPNLSQSCKSETLWQSFSTGDYLHYGPDNSLLGLCPVHYRMLSYISGIHPVDASSILPPMLWQPSVSPDITYSPFCWQKSFGVENHCPVANSSGQCESTEHTLGLSQCFCTCWDPPGESQCLTLLGERRLNCLRLRQSPGMVPTPFSAISVCQSPPAGLTIDKLLLILLSVLHRVQGRWEVVIKLAFVLFLSYESVFSETHSLRT